MKMLSLVRIEILIAQVYTRCMCAKSLQSCPTLCNPMDCSAPGSCIHGILQARVLEWVAIPFSMGSPWPREQTCVSCIEGGLFTIWDTRQAFYQVHAKRWKPLLLPKKKKKNLNLEFAISLFILLTPTSSQHIRVPLLPSKACFLKQW